MGIFLGHFPPLLFRQPFARYWVDLELDPRQSYYPAGMMPEVRYELLGSKSLILACALPWVSGRSLRVAAPTSGLRAFLRAGSFLLLALPPERLPWFAFVLALWTAFGIRRPEFQLV